MALTKEQKKIRSRGIGASEIAAIAGLNPYRGPIDVYMTKHGIGPQFSGNWATRRGDTMEPVIATWYGEQVGAVRLVQGTTMVHPNETWVIATPDYHVHFDDAPERIVEIKDVGGNVAHHWDTDVPDYVKCQVYWQQLVTGCCFSDVAASINGTEPVIFQVEDSPEIRNSLLEIGRSFWFDHVLAEVPPDVDGSRQYADYLASSFKRHDSTIIKADDEVLKWWEIRRDAKLQIKEAEEQKLLAENNLAQLVGENAGVWSHGWRAKWVRPKSGGVDWKAVASDLGATRSDIQKRVKPGKKYLNYWEKTG